jgi:hypothetical protein
MVSTEPLLRRQYLISSGQANKLDALSKHAHVSAAEVVRRAIDAYDPGAEQINAAELEIVVEKLGEALHAANIAVERATQQVNATVEALGQRTEQDAVRQEVIDWVKQNPSAFDNISLLFAGRQGTT